MNGLRRMITVAAFAAALLLAACDGLAGEPQIVATLRPAPTFAPVVNAPETPPDLALGARIYAENCTRCHGAEGRGDGEFVLDGRVPFITDLTDPAQRQGDTLETFYQIITVGKLDTLMPPWNEALTDDERWAVAGYTYALADGGTVAQAPEVTPEAAAQATALPEESAATMMVDGQVTMGTAGVSVPEGLGLNLHVMDARFADGIIEATTGADGAYQFDNVPMYPGQQYVLTTSYKGVVFASEVVTLEAEATTLELPMMVYEVTSDPASVQLDTLLTQVGVAGGELQLVQLARFVNTTDRVYINVAAGGQTSVGMAAPQGATYRDFTGARYQVNPDNSVFEVRPVMPGEPHLMHLTWAMPYVDSGVTVNQTLLHPLAGTYQVLLGTEGLEVDGGGLVEGEPMTMGTQTMRDFRASVSVAAGGAAPFTVRGTPAAIVAPTAPSAGPNWAALLLIGVGLAALGGAGLLFVRERRTKAPDAPALSPQADALVAQIAALDADFQAGKLTQAMYEKKRDKLKQRLAGLMGK